MLTHLDIHCDVTHQHAMGILVVEYDKQVCANDSSVRIQRIAEASK